MTSGPASQVTRMAAETDQTTPSPSNHVGKALRRKEDPRLITGKASYVDDINLVGQLWAAWVRSPDT